jgi:hypothetical protein
MRKILKVSMTAAIMEARNANEANFRLWWGLAESAFSGSLESGSRFCVGPIGRNVASVTMKIFSHLIYFIKTFYKYCTFNAICKDNAAINCITVQHKKG